MSAKDISRFLFQPRKRYSGVRMQQGRVILDSDWNESERIDDEEARQTTLEVVCARGTPNDGFRLHGELDPTTYDFGWKGGSFYLGGLRFQADDQPAERFIGQTDWLQIDADIDSLPPLPSADELASDRYDLVYLRGWEQSVSAVEDSELRERALGGPDTSVRMRRMRRVEVLPMVPSACGEAFERLKEKLTAGGAGSLDNVSGELLSAARLTVTFDGTGSAEDPCRPSVVGGFLGAENQTIRVQLTESNRFIWGYDNAAPLYRVQVLAEEGEYTKIKFLTPPRDQLAQPLKGQAVEVLPWGALLPNGEKVAELRGHLATVATSYDPEERTLTIETGVPKNLIDWLETHGQYHSDRDPKDTSKYFYLKLWTGGSGDPATPDHDLTAAAPLLGTGLRITLSGQGRPGEYWIIAARPNTPDEVVPWELKHGAAPAGPRYFFAPLAVICWSLDSNQQAKATIRDCRHRFRALCEVRGCCTVTVGDGATSHGDFDSIEEAVAYLPPEGGDVCLLPGQHETNVVIEGRQNITIRGCGKETRLIPRDRKRPIVLVIDSECISLENVDLVTLEGTAIVLHGGEVGALREIDIGHTRILAFEDGIRATGGSDLHIHNNRIRILDKRDGGVGIRMLAEDSLIERNDITVVPPELMVPPERPGGSPDPTDPCEEPDRIYLDPFIFHWLLGVVFKLFLFPFLPKAPYKALGGIQIAAASERVKILDNTINGGDGNGITLGGAWSVPNTNIDDVSDQPHVIEHPSKRFVGSVISGGEKVKDIGLQFAPTSEGGSSVWTETDENGNFNIEAIPNSYNVMVTTPGWRIEKIDASGISDQRVYRIQIVQVEQPRAAPSLAFLYEIQIDRNEITNMGRSGIGTVGVGRLALAHSVEVSPLLDLLGSPVFSLGIHRNYIHDCARNLVDQEASVQRRGIGGISLGYCEDARITSNRIEDNGPDGRRPVCGIFISLVEGVDIHHNHIRGNGPISTNGNPELQRGQRGGIVVTAASFTPPSLGLTRELDMDLGTPAARIHDNVVQQPVGQALRLFAFGAVSICDNRFHSDATGREAYELWSGVVMVLNAGRGPSPSGLTLFNDNQVRLGSRSRSITAQLIYTLDDLGFDANQSNALSSGVALNDTLSLFFNTILFGRTLRVTDSRFKESLEKREISLAVSLISSSQLLNNTNDNQGDHCIFAHNDWSSRPPNSSGNQVLDDALCQQEQDPVRRSLGRFYARSLHVSDQ